MQRPCFLLTVENIKHDEESVFSNISIKKEFVLSKKCCNKFVYIDEDGALCPEFQLFPISHFLEIGLINSTRGRHSVPCWEFECGKITN